MDQNKIGNFISTERKNKKLTQKELSEKLNISEKTISKWECGKGLPEVSLMKPLCKELDITITELLNGEKELKKAKEDGIINYMSYTKKKSKHKIVLISILFVLLITFILSTVIYFFNTYNKIIVYRLYGESENFYIRDLYVTKSNMYNMMFPGALESKDPYISLENVKSFIIKYEDKTITGGIPQQNVVEKNGYNEIFTEEKLNNLDKWYIEIEYQYNDELKKETINLNNEILMRNNEFISKKVSPIGIENKAEETYEERYAKKQKENERIGNLLIENGYFVDFKDELGDYISYGKYITTEELVIVFLSHGNPRFQLDYKLKDGTYMNIDSVMVETSLDQDIITAFKLDNKEYEVKYIVKEDKIESNIELPKSINLLEIMHDYVNIRYELYELINE